MISIGNFGYARSLFLMLNERLPQSDLGWTETVGAPAETRGEWTLFGVSV